jgi:FkbM family methyltransferase
MTGRLRYRISELLGAFRRGGFVHALGILLRRICSDIYGISRRIYAIIKSRGGVVILPVQGSLMALRLDDPGLSRTLIRDGIREQEHTQLIRDEIGPGMVGVDLGANLGYYALMEAKLVGPNGLVLAIEPVPANVQMLRHNVALNKYQQVRVFQMAIGGETCEVPMWVTRESNFCNLFSEMDENLTPAMQKILTGHNAATQIVVPAMTLDQFLETQGISEIDFIRMDIEGFEIKVTDGMRKTFANSSKPLKMFVEVHNNHFKNPQQIVGTWLRGLFDIGFRPKALAVPGETNGILRNLSAQEFPELLCSFRSGYPHLLLVKD